MLPVSEVRGYKAPRLFTPPLRELTEETSYGFSVISFAKHILDMPLDPWQEEAVIRLGELLPDGTPRFRTVLILVARQNGKTHLVKVLTLWWMFWAKVGTVLGLANKRNYAKDIWQEVCEIAQANGTLSQMLPEKAIFSGMGQESLVTVKGCKYIFSAANRNAGRSKTINRLIIDEIREHRNRDAWNASIYAGNAVPDFQAVCISNQGDDTGIVLDELRSQALSFIETGEGDPRLGLLEWSSPDGSDPEDLEALAMSNPNLGYRIQPDALLGAAKRAKAAGGREMGDFRTEVMCMRVRLLDPAVDPDRWIDCGTGDPLDLADHRDKTVLCLDVSLSGDHAMLVACAVVDGVAHLEVAGTWSGYGCTQLVREQLPDIVAGIAPRQVGWFPAGPAAALTADMTASKTRNWPPRGTELVEVRGELVAVCMGLSEQVRTVGLRHPRDPILDSHIAGAQKLYRGDAYAFRRMGVDPCNGAYAAAGALHLARMLPAPRQPAIFL